MDRVLAYALVLGVLFVTGCRKETSGLDAADDACFENDEVLSAHASVVPTDAIPPQQKLLADPPLNSPGSCQFYYYCCNQETGVPAPPGHVWRYCVCQQRDYNDPVSLNLEGGWTYPAWNCTQDWSEY